jgi:hypothetical protein
VAGNPRRSVTDDLLADVRPQSVSTNQGRSGHRSLCEMDSDAAAVLLVTDHFTARAQIDEVAITASAHKHAEQVAPMHDGIGIAESLAKRLVERNADNLFGRNGVHQPKLVAVHGHIARRVADAKLVE